MNAAAILACFLAGVCHMPPKPHRLHCGMAKTQHVWKDSRGETHFETGNPHKACFGRQATRRYLPSGK